MNELNDILTKIIKFRDDRDWSQFHNPKDLAIAISTEAAELLELFLWKNPDGADTNKVKEEVADILIFTILITEKYGFDIPEIISEKIKLNNEKYPIEKSKGTAQKYSDLNEA